LAAANKACAGNAPAIRQTVARRNRPGERPSPGTQGLGARGTSYRGAKVSVPAGPSGSRMRCRGSTNGIVGLMWLARSGAPAIRQSKDRLQDGELQQGGPPGANRRRAPPAGECRAAPRQIGIGPADRSSGRGVVGPQCRAATLALSVYRARSEWPGGQSRVRGAQQWFFGAFTLGARGAGAKVYLHVFGSGSKP